MCLRAATFERWQGAYFQPKTAKICCSYKPQHVKMYSNNIQHPILGDKTIEEPHLTPADIPVFETWEPDQNSWLASINTVYPVFCLLCPVSCVLCPVSCVLSHVSCLLCPVCCVLSPVSCLMCPVFCVLSPVACLWKKMSRVLVRYLIEVEKSSLQQTFFFKNQKKKINKLKKKSKKKKKTEMFAQT